MLDGETMHSVYVWDSPDLFKRCFTEIMCDKLYIKIGKKGKL